MFSTAPISHSRIRYPSSSDFSPMMRPDRLPGASPLGTALPARTAAGGIRGVLRCRKCRQNTGLTVGTVMERSHTPLNVWFWAAYLIQDARHVRRAVSGQLGLSATRRPFKFSTSSARAWCGPTKTGSVDSPRTMLRWTKPGLAGERVGKAVVFTTRFPSPVPSRCVIESRAPSSNRKDGRYAGRVRLAVVLDRSAESLCGFVESTVAPGSPLLTIGAAMLASVSAAMSTSLAECGDSSNTCRSSIWFSPT